MLAPLPWYNPIMSAFQALAAVSVAFLAFGRYRVLRDPISYWLGVGFGTVSITLIFYELTWPGLRSDGGAVLGHLPSTALWTGRVGPMVLSVALLAAVLIRWPGQKNLTGGKWLWSVAGWIGLVLVIETSIVLFEAHLPVLVGQSGTFTDRSVVMQLAMMVLFGAGAVLSTRHYMRSGDPLPGYAALCQITYVFVELTLSIGLRRYDLWWYSNRILLVSGFLAVMFGFLLEYARLFRRETEKTRELQAKSAELQQALLALSQDIAERKQTEAALRASEHRVRKLNDELQQRSLEVDAERARWQGVVEGIADEVWICDLHGKMTLINLPEVTAMGLDAFKDKSIEDVLSEVDILRPNGQPRTAEEAPLLRALRGEVLRGEEIMRHRRTGKICWRLFSSAPTRDAAGRITGGVAIVRDITDRKQAEEALIRSEKLATVGRMAATIAHEINNPLAAVMNTLYIARLSPALPDTVQRYLDLADEELKRISHITRQALGFYRESSLPTQVALPLIVDSVLDLLQSKIKAKHATIDRQYRTDMAVTAISGELRQVFSNLVANSLDALGQSGTIKVRISVAPGRTEGNFLRITIADNGQGIDAAVRPRIFEPLFTTKDAIGTGLGLWVSKQIVDKHGGRIRLHSTTSGSRRGTSFSLLLPATAEVVSRSASSMASD